MAAKLGRLRPRCRREWQQISSDGAILILGSGASAILIRTHPQNSGLSRTPSLIAPPAWCFTPQRQTPARPSSLTIDLHLAQHMSQCSALPPMSRSLIVGHQLISCRQPSSHVPSTPSITNAPLHCHSPRLESTRKSSHQKKRAIGSLSHPSRQMSPAEIQPINPNHAIANESKLDVKQSRQCRMQCIVIDVNHASEYRTSHPTGPGRPATIA
jgi:hypothetical protein